ncbi:SGNH/GDSL hydrolase family protein [Agrilactobacillus fermenti]|uniref:SGNH/GDSL hydrolase family protein n=1 Tax=Agrilactobacillus fermenti TaxID=2586909 RepID=UPI001E5203B5|nr:GDSL-type esterase/lipase family protein [Agrilactobacillus fermenti]MCD2257094.1 esterase [Agrilactobacillus fermenti]
MKIVLFGDSIFAGYHQGLTSSIFKDRIQEQFPNDTIVNAAIPGATTLIALAWLQSLVLDEKPDLVVIHFGANDIPKDTAITTADYVHNIDTLCQKIGLDKVSLISPPYSDDKRLGDRTQAEIQAYVNALLTYGAKHKLPTGDLYTPMHTKKDPNELLQSDGIHFTNRGYDILTQVVSRQINHWLQRT